MSKIKRVKYFTDEKKKLISKDNQKLYDKYLKSSIIKNPDVKSTTYAVYQNYMSHFLVYLAEEWDNMGLYSEEFMEEAVDILEGYISFCQQTLNNNKKVINTKLSTISSFFLWSMKRGFVDRHPFDKKLDRMKGATEERIINHYFLNDEQIEEIREGLKDEKKFDIQDTLMFELFLESANRVGAVYRLTLSSMNLDTMEFVDIREKRGKHVEVVFNEEIKQIIEKWMEMRKEMDNCEVDALFITKYNGEYKKMSYGTIQERVKKMGKILGLEDFHCHCIRKTSLNSIYEKTGDLALASAMANHESTDTTKKSYIKPESKSELRDKIKMKKEIMKKQKKNDDNKE